MTYSRPSAAKPPNPLSMRRAGRACASRSADGGGRRSLTARRGIAGSSGTRRRAWSASGARVAGGERRADGLQQRAVFGADLVGGPHEDAARAVDDVGFDARGDEPHDLV